MLDDRPLPPNWESHLDVNTQRWFFVDHVNKKTSWDDPRPAYYSARERKIYTSTERRPAESQSPTLDASYASLVSDYDKETFSSPKENECDSREEEFMEYLHALRAAYPDHKDRQLAKLMEKWLGDSVSLRKFVAVHLKRKVSSSSETTTKLTSRSSTQKSDSVKRCSSPHSTVRYEETKEADRSNLSPFTRLGSNAPTFTAGVSESISLALIQTPEPGNNNVSGKRETKELDSSTLLSSSVARADGMVQPFKSNTKPVQNRFHTQQSPGGKTETNPKMVADLQGSTEKLRNLNMNTSIFAPVVRCTARGSDPQLRGSRFAPCGPNRKLALGPDPRVHRGPDPRLLTHRPIDTPPLTNAVSASDFDLFKSVICSSLV
ncbi:hypothetical protein D915_009888 [Fasciola hepatica]|uniref:WW domain-containing protein n=1 Tax=Fasciola hepatica TaxID=6192 RepID=A0A4E0R0N3_FASHE|nr:hypothetical protein D915_009888 [Fasciola hepatica]